ncbi:MAG: hypothetical protein R6W96_06910 [Clostridia bacterium]
MKKKSIAILLMSLLIFITLAQAFIILDYYLEGFSLGIFNRREEPQPYFRAYESVVREKYLVPFKIYANIDDARLYEITRQEGNFHSLIWENSRFILQEALARERDEKLGLEQWYNICIMKGVSLRFADALPSEFLAWMVEANDNALRNVKIEKILFAVQEEDTVDMYLKTPDSILLYKGLESQGLLRTTNYANLTDLLKTSAAYINNKYSYSRVAFGTSRLRVEPDIPIIMRTVDESFGFRTLELIQVKPLALLSEYAALAEKASRPLSGDATLAAKANGIRSMLFGRSHDRYKTVISEEASIFFTNQYNIYEVTIRNRMTYVYTPGVEGMEKGSLEAAFMNALDTLNIFYNLNGSKVPGMFISGILETDGYYEFMFNYLHENRPVVFKGLDHAVRIKATATRTIEADVMMLEISGLEDVSMEYDAEFYSLIQRNDIEMLGLVSDNMYFGYEIEELTDRFLQPVWINEKHDGEKTAWEMAR